MLYPETFDLCAGLQIRFCLKTMSNSQLQWRNDAVNISYPEDTQLLRELRIPILIFIKTSKIVWIPWHSIILLPLDSGWTCDFSGPEFPEAVTLTVPHYWHPLTAFSMAEKRRFSVSVKFLLKETAPWEKNHPILNLKCFKRTTDSICVLRIYV